MTAQQIVRGDGEEAGWLMRALMPLASAVFAGFFGNAGAGADR